MRDIWSNTKSVRSPRSLQNKGALETILKFLPFEMSEDVEVQEISAKTHILFQPSFKERSHRITPALYKLMWRII